MKIHYFTGLPVSETKKYSHQIEDLIDDEWHDKATRMQSRRWKKIHERESYNHSRHNRGGSHRQSLHVTNPTGLLCFAI